MPRKIAPVLDEILKALDGILMSTSGKSFADFERDWLLRHGVQRGIEIISEASRHIPARLKSEHPGVRWAAIAGIGNVLRHEYHDLRSGDLGCRARRIPSLARRHPCAQP